MKTQIKFKLSSRSDVTHLDSHPVFDDKTIGIMTRETNGFLKFTFLYEKKDIEEVRVKIND